MEKEKIKWGKIYWQLCCPNCEEIDFNIYGKVKPSKKLYLKCKNCKTEYYILNAEKFKIKKKNSKGRDTV